MTPQDRRAQLKVLIGGAHPEGKLDKPSEETLRQALEKMTSENGLQEFAELLEDMYYSHGERITSILRKYSRMRVAFEMKRHITFVEHQNEILDGDREGEVDDECAKLLYVAFMDYLHHSILKWADIYSDHSYDSHD